MPKLELPDSGVIVRMYRQGHGDCFLLAMPCDGGGQCESPSHVVPTLQGPPFFPPW